ncbi:hypothetical protein M0R45_032103 [Rubus argutus]|uniref:Uncharacterized protein n=1 Tax=Rubus argutus TaxID=59490 RepID=A0AAW1WJ71_RUBAR
MKKPQDSKTNTTRHRVDDITSTSNSDDSFPRKDFRFSGYPSHIGGTLHDPLVDVVRGGGNQHHIFHLPVNSQLSSLCSDILLENTAASVVPFGKSSLAH